MADALSLEWETEVFRQWTETLVDGLTREETAKALRKTALNFTDRVVKKTPVDTGRARAGWLAYADSEGHDVEVVGEVQAIAQGRQASDFNAQLFGEKQFIEIVNAVRYILHLEFGSSDQAPAGMVRVAMRELAAQQALTKAMRDRLQSLFRQANRTARAAGKLPG